MNTQSHLENVSLIVLRLIIAAIFISAAYAKVYVWKGDPVSLRTSAEMINLLRFISVAELLGGAALLVGVLTRAAAVGLAIIMVGAIGMMQFAFGIGFSTNGGPGWSYPLAVLGGCLALIAFGAGTWSIDRLMMMKGK